MNRREFLKNISLISGIIVAGKTLESCEKENKYSINSKFCTYCGKCYNVCPYEAIEPTTIELEGQMKNVYIIKGKCKSCGRCVGACQYNAISNE